MMIGLRIDAGGAVAEFFDTSRVPDDPAYWHELEVRVGAALLRRASMTRWLTTGRSAWLAAASIAVAAALAVSVAELRHDAGNAAEPQGLAIAIVPTDHLGRLLAGSDVPPTLWELTASDAPTTRGAP